MPNVLLRRLEVTRSVLDAMANRLENVETYDIVALSDAATRGVDRRPRDAHLAELVARLVPVQRRAMDPFACHVAGTTFRSLERVLRADGSVAIDAAEDALVVGDELRLEREPANRLDPNAVRVLTLEERWLGYLPRAKSAVVATLVDAGLEVGASIEDVERHADGWLEVQMTVHLFAP